MVSDVCRAIGSRTVTVFANAKTMEHGLDNSLTVKVGSLITCVDSRMFVHLLIEIHCPPLKFHTRVIQTCSPEQTSGSIWTVGTKCQAICNETGYRLIGPSVRQCLSLGYWSGYEQYCIGRRRNEIRIRNIRIFVPAGPEIERITHSTSTTVAPSTSTHRKYLGKAPIHSRVD